jgi:hypothetical protein
MKMPLKMIAAVAISGLLGFGVVQAAPVGLAAASALNQVALEGGGLHQHYTEWARGFANPNLPNPLDWASGNIGLLRFSAQAYRPSRFGPLWGEVRYDFATGSTTYTGHMQSLAPLDTSTHNTIQDVRGRVGYPIGLPYGITTVLFVEGGYYRWDRSVARGTPAAIEEVYSNGYVGGGLKTLVSPMHNLVLSASADGGSSITGGMAVRSPYRVSTDLGNHPYAGVGMQAAYRIHGNWRLVARIAYRYFGYGISNTVITDSGAGQEPNSTSTQVRYAFGVAYDF